MNFIKYQKDVKRTMNSDPKYTELELTGNFSLGIMEELGEFCGALKKFLYHEHKFNREKLIEEAGDFLWYFTAMLEKYGLTLEEVAKYNVKKLRKRYPNGFDTERSKNRNTSFEE